MLKNVMANGVLVCAALLMSATPCANAQQTLNFSLGYFTPLALDARVDDDVLHREQHVPAVRRRRLQRRVGRR